MNKKLKKMIVAVSAIAMCATSFVSMGAGAVAVFPCEKVTLYTTEFSVGDKKYHLWQKATDYFGLDDLHIFIDETNSSVKAYYQEVSTFVTDGYHMHSEEDLAILENYLSDKGIEYTTQNLSTTSTFDICVITKSPEGTTQDEKYDMWADIKENTGFTVDWFMLLSSAVITDIKNALPEPTLTGDATEDGEVNIADAVLIMQSLSNPNEYKLTPQGMANADMDGDGVTALDALTIQQMLLDK